MTGLPVARSGHLLLPGITLVDDSSKFKRPADDERRSLANRLPGSRGVDAANPNSAVRPLVDRVRDPASTRNDYPAQPRNMPELKPQRQQVASFDALDLTPTYTVIDGVLERGDRDDSGAGYFHDRMTPTPQEPLSRRRNLSTESGLGARADSSDSERVRVGERERSYHPPRMPPESIIPPAPETSISVAPEYDPRAPTKPRVRRPSTAPPPPALFGLDRMLVWGMVLGGLFVATIVILVHRLAPSGQAARKSAAQGIELPVASTSSQRAVPPSGAVPVQSGAPRASTSAGAPDAGPLSRRPRSSAVPAKQASPANKPPSASAPPDVWIE